MNYELSIMNYQLSIINYEVSPTPPLAPPLHGWGITDERSNCEIVKLSNCDIVRIKHLKKGYDN